MSESERDWERKVMAGVGGGWGDLGRNSGGDGKTTNRCMSLSFYKEYSSSDLRPLKPIVDF